MKEINIAGVLANKRRERGITQEELADFIGVSKASVSKWETEQSYPDVTFLPQIASYFDISIDELMDYRPQMAKGDIKKLYLRLSADFASKPFCEVIGECRTIIKKYYSCYPLLLQMALLIMNHTDFSGDKEKTAGLVYEACEIFRRVREDSDDVHLIKQAQQMEAICLLSAGKPEKVLELLGDKAEPLLSPETIIASALKMSGRTDEAKEVLQASMFQNLVLLFNYLPSYLLLNTDNIEKYEETLKRGLAVAEAFNLKRLHPVIYVSFLLTAAVGYITAGKNDKAIDLIELYADTVTGNLSPLKLHGDSYFDLLDNWVSGLDLGGSLPRDEKSIRKSMGEAVLNNPVFSALFDSARFNLIMDRIKGGCLS